MNIVDNYLQELFGKKKKEQTPELLPAKIIAKNNGYDVVDNTNGLANPFNYKSIKLDKNITNEDLHNARDIWTEKIIKGFALYDRPVEFFRDDSAELLRQGKLTATIIDGNKRVGIISAISTFFNIVCVIWVPGKNYATRGIMKFLNSGEICDQFELCQNEFGLSLFKIISHKADKETIEIVKNLKLFKNRSAYYDSTKWQFFIESPYWWNNGKLLNNYTRYCTDNIRYKRNNNKLLKHK